MAKDEGSGEGLGESSGEGVRARGHLFVGDRGSGTAIVLCVVATPQRAPVSRGRPPCPAAPRSSHSPPPCHVT
eukprot:4463792-Prymnesium_polylepis.1